MLLDCEQRYGFEIIAATVNDFDISASVVNSAKYTLIAGLHCQWKEIRLELRAKAGHKPLHVETEKYEVITFNDDFIL